MPADQRGRLYDREDGPPVDQLGEHGEGDPRRIIGAVRLDSALCHTIDMLRVTSQMP